MLSDRFTRMAINLSIYGVIVKRLFAKVVCKSEIYLRLVILLFDYRCTQFFSGLSLDFVPRSCNMLAHLLAFHGLSLPSFKEWFLIHFCWM